MNRKGLSYDNAVAEGAFKVIKTEFIKNEKFDSLWELRTKFMDYVNWYNNIRYHRSLGYMTPVEFRNNLSEKKVS